MKIFSLLNLSSELIDKIEVRYPPDKTISRFFKEKKFLGSHDRKFISETVYGVIRWRRLLEYYFEKLSNQFEINKEYTLSFIYSLIYQISIQKNGEILKSSTQDEQKLLNELQTELLNISSNEITNIGIKYSYPDWLIEEWKKNCSEEKVEEVCKSNNLQAPITLRVNTLKINRENCQKELAKENIPSSITNLSPFGLNLEKRLNVFSLKSFKSGYFEVQDEASQIVAQLVNPKPGEKIIDACCGAGGKSLALAALMKNKGEIFAFDISEKRISDFKIRIKRAGVDIVRINILKDESIPKKYFEVADKLLIDAPCSGIGTLRRNPGLKWSVNEQMILELTQKQQKILQNFSKTLKISGMLIYATCSTNELENKVVISKFLENSKNFILEEPSVALKYFGLENIVKGKYLKLFPHINNTDGFFGAVLRKIN